ncbi:MAG TPA: DUF6458 family protein [Candidatus Limnocylindrales bacterium]|nr:DUF6458 family protein [Candidatus Limnocylindrales bacterium]
MGIGVSIFLLAVGAILTFAVNAEVAGLDVSMVGVILMIAGGIGLLMTLLVWGPRDRVARDRVIETEVR